MDPVRALLIDSWDKQSRPSKTYALTTFVESEPQHYKDIFGLPDEKDWNDAVEREFQSMIKNKVYELVKLPPGRKAIGCRWVLRKKYDQHGNVKRYKARLTAKGYAQRQGIDYLETFAPVARQNSLRLVLSIAASNDWEIDQGDIETAFLLANMKDGEIYMEQPEGYVVEGKEDYVWKLNKAIYGTKQAPRVWNRKWMATSTPSVLKPVMKIHAFTRLKTTWKRTADSIIIRRRFTHHRIQEDGRQIQESDSYKVPILRFRSVKIHSGL